MIQFEDTSDNSHPLSVSFVCSQLLVTLKCRDVLMYLHSSPLIPTQLTFNSY